MPRRKTLTLNLDTLECGDKIYQLLYDELIDYDLSTVKVTVQEEIENKIIYRDGASKSGRWVIKIGKME